MDASGVPLGQRNLRCFRGLFSGVRGLLTVPDRPQRAVNLLGKIPGPGHWRPLKQLADIAVLLVPEGTSNDVCWWVDCVSTLAGSAHLATRPVDP